MFALRGYKNLFPQSEWPRPPSHGTAKPNRDTFEDIRAVTTETLTINTTTSPCCIKTHAGATPKRQTNPSRTSGTNSQLVLPPSKRHRVSKTLYIQRMIIRKLNLTQQTQSLKLKMRIDHRMRPGLETDCIMINNTESFYFNKHLL